MHGEARNGKREAKKDRGGGGGGEALTKREQITGRKEKGRKGRKGERDVFRKCMRTSDVKGWERW